MSETDWEAHYQSGDMPWDKGEPSPGLVDFLQTHPHSPGATVLVPGCGTGHDLAVWAQAGFQATGLDLAPSAVKLTRERIAQMNLNAEMRLGNFLDDPHHAKFDWLFEHTLFCAIHPTQRDHYVRAAHACLKPDGQFLAVHYLIPDTEGPPFGTTREEVVERFEPYFDLIDDCVPRSYPNRKGLERMFHWRKRPGAITS